MKLEEFELFISKIGFQKSLTRGDELGIHYSLIQKLEKEGYGILNHSIWINITEDLKFAKLGSTNFTGLILRGSNLKDFSIENFNKKQEIEMMEIIKEELGFTPHKFLEYLRDSKIGEILG
jgi:hypothetical protein